MNTGIHKLLMELEACRPESHPMHAYWRAVCPVCRTPGRTLYIAYRGTSGGYAAPTVDAECRHCSQSMNRVQFWHRLLACLGFSVELPNGINEDNEQYLHYIGPNGTPWVGDEPEPTEPATRPAATRRRKRVKVKRPKLADGR